MKTCSLLQVFLQLKTFMRYEFPCFTLDRSTKTTTENACFSLMKALCTCWYIKRDHVRKWGTENPHAMPEQVR